MGAEEGLRQNSGMGRLRLQHPRRNPEPRPGGSDHRDRASCAVREAKNLYLQTAKCVEGVADDNPISRETGILTGLC